MPLPFKPRILILPLAAVVIGALVFFKTNQPTRELTPEARKAVLSRRPAQSFKLHDQRSQPFRLDRYLGRHKLLIVFFDPSKGASRNAQLQILKAGYAQLTAHGEKVIAISSATPYANRESFKRGGDFPFHVLSDADYSVETAWGCMTQGDPPQVIPSAFVVDRAGVIHWSQIGGPSPIAWQDLLKELRAAR
jgi:peroxiredoxin